MEEFNDLQINKNEKTEDLEDIFAEVEDKENQNDFDYTSLNNQTNNIKSNNNVVSSDLPSDATVMNQTENQNVNLVEENISNNTNNSVRRPKAKKSILVIILWISIIFIVLAGIALLAWAYIPQFLNKNDEVSNDQQIENNIDDLAVLDYTEENTMDSQEDDNLNNNDLVDLVDNTDLTNDDNEVSHTYINNNQKLIDDDFMDLPVDEYDNLNIDENIDEDLNKNSKLKDSLDELYKNDIDIINSDDKLNQEDDDVEIEKNNSDSISNVEDDNDIIEENNIEENELLDSDSDGLSDEEEKELGTDPLKVDSDGDTLTDRDEVFVYKTNPLEKDSDGDGYDDNVEIENGYNPNGEGKLEE